MIAKEIIIRAASVSPELTRAASGYLLSEFGGYWRTDGFGGHTMADGSTIEESAIAWHIATAETGIKIRIMMAAFARLYCAAGKQESIYFRAANGEACLINARGQFIPL